MNIEYVRIYVGGNNEVAYLFKEGEHLKVWINKQVDDAPEEAKKIRLSDKATSFEVREINDAESYT